MVRRGRALLATIALVVVACGESAGPESPPGESQMVQAAYAEEDLLGSYLEATLPYDPSGMPTTLERQAVVERLLREVTPVQRAERLERLSLVAIYYDAGEAAASFEALLAREDGAPLDPHRGAIALATLAWIGDAEQQRRALAETPALLESADFAAQLELPLRVYYAFGPRLDPGSLRSWAGSEHARIEAEVAVEREGGDREVAEVRRERLARAEALLEDELTSLEYANRRRREIGMMDGDGAIAALVQTYVDPAEEGPAPLRFWAAVELLRRSRLDAEQRPRIAAALDALREGLDDAPLQDEEEAEERDLVRATCLRGARFFGRELSDDERAWLDEQEDDGSDWLLYRPDPEGSSELEDPDDPDGPDELDEP